MADERRSQGRGVRRPPAGRGTVGRGAQPPQQQQQQQQPPSHAPPVAQQPQQAQQPRQQPPAQPQGAWGAGRPSISTPSVQQAPQGAWARGQPGPVAPGAQRQVAPAPYGSQPLTRPPMSLVGTGRAKQVGSSSGSDKAAEAVRSLSLAEGPSGEAKSAPVGRGGIRGRRQLPPELVMTKPASVNTKQGKYGQPQKMQANYFPLPNKTDWCLFHYDVKFTPEEDRLFVRRALLRNHRETLGAYIFDGTSMFTSSNLQQPLELTTNRQEDGVPVTMRITRTREMDPNSDPEYVQFYNILMRKCLRLLNLQLVGRNYFDSAAQVFIPEYGLELWPGYSTSIRQHDAGLLMCTEITHKVMRTETVLDILSRLYNDSRDYQNAFKREVIGSIVLTRYNNNTYRVEDVNFNSNPRATFTNSKGQTMSYMDYYKNKYGKNILEPTQPLLIARASQRERRAEENELICLIPELCTPTGLTEAMIKNFQLMKVLKSHTQVEPQNRIDKLMRFNQRLQTTPEVMNEFRDWNMQLGNDLVQVDGRWLGVESLIFGGNKISQLDPSANWDRTITSEPMLMVCPLKDWVAIVPQRFSNDFRKFLGLLISGAGRMRFPIDQPRVQVINDDRANSYTRELEEVLSKGTPQLVFCVSSNVQLERYSAIKKKCCVDRPVPSQVILAKTLGFEKKLAGIAAKVAMQLNCKLGGCPWAIHIPIKGMVVFGYDVCHDSGDKSKSVGAMVATMNNECTKFFSSVAEHRSGEELSNTIGLDMVRALIRYRETHGSLPQRIMFYRDGVGDGQIETVRDVEVVSIKQRLNELYGGEDKYKLTFIIVNKRINTRFFLKGRNPVGGTVVDNGVTNPFRYDFFLISQSVRQGTVSPTYYNVIEDNSSWSPDNIQRLTYKLCFTYYNTSQTVRVPAPCHYAHKLAFLVSQAIHRPPSQQLENQLYFL